MSEGATTEVYICQKGQSIREGALEVRPEITRPDQAEADATAKCDGDKRIEKVVYYRVSEDGDNKLLLKYENPYFHATTGAEVPRPDADKPSPAPRSAEKTKEQAAPKVAQAGKSLAETMKRVADRLLFEDEPQATQETRETEATEEPQAEPANGMRLFVSRVADIFSQK